MENTGGDRWRILEGIDRWRILEGIDIWRILGKSREYWRRISSYSLVEVV